MVFGTLYYQGFAKKDKHHGDKHSGSAKGPEGPKDTESGIPEDEKAALLTKGDDK